jgi:hypothetical protein
VTTPRIVKDPEIYGVEFRCVDGVIEWRHNPPFGAIATQREWRPLTTVVRGNLSCELGWSAKRLRVWASLLDRPDKKSAESSAEFSQNLPETPVEIAAHSGAKEAK